MSGSFRIGGGIATTLPPQPMQTAVATQPMAASMPYIGRGSYGSMAEIPLTGNAPMRSLGTIPATTAPRTIPSMAPPVATIGNVLPVTSSIAPVTVSPQSIVAPPLVGAQTIYPTIPSNSLRTSVPQITSLPVVGSVSTLPATRVNGGYGSASFAAPGTEMLIGPSYGYAENGAAQYAEDGAAPPQLSATSQASGFDPLVEPEEEVDDGDDQEMSGQWKFKGITKPRTKWRSGKDKPGDWPIEHPQASHGVTEVDKIDIPRAVEMRQKQQRNVVTPNEMSKIQEDKPWPFWIGAGTPTARLEPTWIDGSWYLVAPVDFKGIDKLPKEIQHGELNTVDEALRMLAEEDRIPALPPPRHWKEHKNCPIA